MSVSLCVCVYVYLCVYLCVSVSLCVFVRLVLFWAAKGLVESFRASGSRPKT